MPMLMNLTGVTASSPTVKMLHGFEGLKQTYLEILPHEFLGMMDPAVMYKAFGTTTTKFLFDKKIEMRGRDLIVQGESTERFLRDLEQTNDYSLRLLPPMTQFSCDVLVWQNNVALLSFDAQYTVVQVESAEISAMMRSWFETLWSISSPVPLER